MSVEQQAALLLRRPWVEGSEVSAGLSVLLSCSSLTLPALPTALLLLSPSTVPPHPGAGHAGQEEEGRPLPWAPQ